MQFFKNGDTLTERIYAYVIQSVSVNINYDRKFLFTSYAMYLDDIKNFFFEMRNEKNREDLINIDYTQIVPCFKGEEKDNIFEISDSRIYFRDCFVCFYIKTTHPFVTPQGILSRRMGLSLVAFIDLTSLPPISFESEMKRIGADKFYFILPRELLHISLFRLLVETNEKYQDLKHQMVPTIQNINTNEKMEELFVRPHKIYVGSMIGFFVVFNKDNILKLQKMRNVIRNNFNINSEDEGFHLTLAYQKNNIIIPNNLQQEIIKCIRKCFFEIIQFQPSKIFEHRNILTYNIV